MKYVKFLGACVVCLTTSLFSATSLAAPSFDSQKFVKIAAEKSMSEIEIAKIAINKSNNIHIKNYAKNIIKEQQLALDALRVFAGMENLDIASNSALQKDAWVIVLEREGMSFDMAYADMRLEERKKVVNLYRNAISSKNIASQNYALHMLPALMQDLYQAQQLVQQLQNDNSLGDTKKILVSKVSM